jgi:hypothetical protein
MDIETQSKIEIIYGLLWCVDVDTRTISGMAASIARKTAADNLSARGMTP